MKKIAVTLAMIFTLAVCAFANDEKVSPEVLNAFKTRFVNAQEVTWKEGNEYYKVNFTYHSYRMCAFYSTSGEIIGVTRYISSNQLPLFLQNGLEKNYSGYWIADLFELSNAQGFSYYITLQNADRKIILRSEYGGSWEVFQKQNL